MPNKEIKFTLEMDENNFPLRITWEATDAGFEGQRECTSMMINVWDEQENNTMNIHLWTRQMLVNNMNAHYVHSLMQMAESYQRATRNQKLAGRIRDFAREFLDAVKEQQK